jgi:hypothetical protein
MSAQGMPRGKSSGYLIDFIFGYMPRAPIPLGPLSAAEPELRGHPLR